MRVSIEQIEVAGPTQRARRLVLSGGHESQLTSASVVKQLGLAAGDEFDEDELHSAIASAEHALAKERAFRMLAHHDRSGWELEDVLIKEGYSRAAVTQVLDRLIDLELVDDVRFTESYVRSRFGSGYGVRRILRELRDKGVDEAIAAQVIAAESSDEDELQRARAALRGRMAGDRKERERLVRRLVSRGFSYAVASEATSGGCDDTEYLA